MQLAAPRRWAVLLLAGIGFAGLSHGWSDQGHRIVALAAEEILPERSRTRVGYLLGKDWKLVEVATWAHELASERPETEAWHSINIPPDAKSVDLDRDCPVGECVTAKVRESIGIVRLAIRGKSEIVDAFKLLVGLAGDMHQPLHNGYPPAQGKEDAIVIIGQDAMRLFEAWDSELLRRMGSEEEVLQLVRERIESADYDDWTQGTLRSWTWETHGIAVNKVYPMLNESGRTYFNRAQLDASNEIIVEQLAKAAVRLVHMLSLTWPP